MPAVPAPQCALHLLILAVTLALSFPALCTADAYAPDDAKDRASLQADASLTYDDNVDRGPGSGVDVADEFLDAGIRRVDTLCQGVDTAFALISSARGDARVARVARRQSAALRAGSSDRTKECRKS